MKINVYQAVLVDNSIEFKGPAEVLHEYLEDKFAAQFGFSPMFQESEDDGTLEIYLHTDTYEDLNEEELDKLDELKITEFDSLETICLLLNIRIEQWNEDQIATCSVCSKDFHEGQINMIDFNEDVCQNCLQKYELEPKESVVESTK